MPNLHLQLNRDDDSAFEPPAPLPEEVALEMMRRAEITAATLIPWGSNYTFAVALEDEEYGERLAIYKPRRGEAPLWDFEGGTLYRREHAAYQLSKRLGWDIVPPTIVRHGPHGIGSVQLYIEPLSGDDENDDADADFAFWGAERIEIERIVLFDLISNNADRKLSHCLRGVDDRIWGIDHGLTFNVEPKLRTVLWQYNGKAVTPELLADLDRFLEREAEHRVAFREDLRHEEFEMLLQRMRSIREQEKYPVLDPHVNVPRGWW